MTGPEGDRHRGFWEVDEVQAPHRLVFRDGFGNEDGTPNAELPVTTVRVTIQEIGGGKTEMSIENEVPSVEAMEQLATMGDLEEGLTQSRRADRRGPRRGRAKHRMNCSTEPRSTDEIRASVRS